MKIRISGIMALGAMILLTSIPAGAAELDFSFNPGGQLMVTGTGKKETYDIAVRLADRAFEGYAVGGMSVPIPSENISGVKAWLSTDLNIETIDGKKQNAPDIVSIDASVENGMLVARFPQQYTITENGVYVGYSFTVDEVNDADGKPVEELVNPVYITDGQDDDGLYIHTSRTYRSWTSLTTRSVVSAMSVTLSGDFGSSSAGISVVPGVWAQYSTPSSVTFTIANQGTEPITSLVCEYEINGVAGSEDISLLSPLAPLFNSKTDIALTLPAISERGDYPLEITITKVNGMANDCRHKSGTGLVKVRPVIPVKRPVMEEFTGTWCGWCVRGFAAMEHMNSRYPDDFIAIAYHSDDPMSTLDLSEFPMPVGGLPFCYIDRVTGCDPYYGIYTFPLGIEKVWNDRRAEGCEVAVEAKAVINEAGDVTVISECTFVEEADGEYGVAFMLLGNGLKGSGRLWYQANYYANGKNGAAEIPEMEKFTGGGDMVDGLEFDDVFITCSDLAGNDAIIGAIIPDKTISNEYVFSDVKNIMSLKGEALVQDTGKLHAVVFIVDRNTGEILNTAKCSVSGDISVDGIAEGTPRVVDTEYYDMQGRQIAEPSEGMYIRTDIFENGSTRTIKIAR